MSELVEILERGPVVIDSRGNETQYDINGAAIAMYQAKQRIEELESKLPKWISVEDRLPESRKKVLAVYKNTHGNTRRICAEYIAPRTELCEDYYAYEEWDGEYDEENDCYWVIAGWRERVENWDYMSCGVCEGEITHWMPLPEPPK
jgi:hypothetical protein